MSRLYSNAARALRAVKSGETLNKYYSRNKIGKEEYALVCETLKYDDVLDQILLRSQLSYRTLDVDEFILKVMLYELLFGKKKIQGGGAVKRIIMQHFDTLKQNLDGEMNESGKTNYSDLQSKLITQSTNLSKYVRINVIKLTPLVGLKELQSSYPRAQFDSDIPSLIKIPAPYHGLSDMNSIKTGLMIIQDKASCFPSQVLYDEWQRSGKSGNFIDACAAPGNKTSHLSALSWDNEANVFLATVFAFDRDHCRCDLLQSRMNQVNASNVIVSCEDFLGVDINLEKYISVSSILVDPSCSGSGVIRSLERVVARRQLQYDDEKIQNDYQQSEKVRIHKLSRFQIAAITKALQFPNVQRVVYSTCSIHEVC